MYTEYQITYRRPKGAQALYGVEFGEPNSKNKALRRAKMLSKTKNNVQIERCEVDKNGNAIVKEIIEFINGQIV